MTTEDDFQRELDANPDNWHMRGLLAEWLSDCNDPRAEGYMAMARLKRRPLQGRNRERDTWWWHNSGADFHNNIPADWFRLLPKPFRNDTFWPMFTTDDSSVKTRRECEDALALAFRQLPPPRQAELLKPPA